MINDWAGPRDGSTSPIMQDHVINHATNMHGWDTQLEVVGRVCAPQQLTIEQCVEEIQASRQVQRLRNVRYTRCRASTRNRSKLWPWLTGRTWFGSQSMCFQGYMLFFFLVFWNYTLIHSPLRVKITKTIITFYYISQTCIQFYKCGSTCCINMMLVYKYTWKIYMRLTFTK